MGYVSSMCVNRLLCISNIQTLRERNYPGEVGTKEGVDGCSFLNGRSVKYRLFMKGYMV